MKTRTFGKRKFGSVGSNTQTDFCTETVKPVANNWLGKTFVYLGFSILTALLLAFTMLMPANASSLGGILDSISNWFVFQTGFASDWTLRSTLGLHAQTLAGHVPMILDFPSPRSLIVALHQASLVVGLGAALFPAMI